MEEPRGLAVPEIVGRGEFGRDVRRGGAKRRPVVLMLDDELWHCFNQLAAALRRDRIDPIRVVTGSARRGRFVRFVERCVYRGVIDVDVSDGLSQLRGVVDSGRVLDVQVNEETLAAIGIRSEVGLLVARASGVSPERREVWIDKLATNATVASLGIAVPEYYPSSDTTPEVAAQRLGFPLVVKRSIGTGGRGVRIVRDLGALKVAVSELGGDGSVVFFQRFVAGDLVGYGAVRSAQGVVAEFTGHETKGHTNPLGPSVGVDTVVGSNSG